MGHTERRDMERDFAGDRRGDARGVVSGMPGGRSVAGEWWSGDELIALGASSGVADEMGGTRDWRLGLIHELRVFMAFVMTCEAGIAPSRGQRAGCVQRLDSLLATLREPPRRGNGRYEVGQQRVGMARIGGSEGVMLRPREIEALGLRHKGLLPKEIAREMGITLLTVRSYIRDAASKLDASGWEAAVRRAIELELL